MIDLLNINNGEIIKISKKEKNILLKKKLIFFLEIYFGKKIKKYSYFSFNQEKIYNILSTIP